MRIVLLLVVFASYSTFGQEATSIDLQNKQYKKYSIERGTISYTISGNAKGNEVFTFDRFGWRSLKKRSMTFELYGIETKQEQHEVADGENVYRINHEDSTIRKRIDKRWSMNASYMKPEQISESILFSLGGTYHSDSILLGKKCQVWTFENKKLQQMWIWNGLALKRISRLGDQIIETTATQIQLDIGVSDSVFKLPENYTKEQ